ncbi:alpha/beta hydrolase family esterase [Aliigemmobacter aestuarii]|nr:PHB depolymerase family esterase [Gemmobacter aestuarii]
MTGTAQADCGQDTDACKAPGGTYHIVLPEDVKKPPPAILLLHGYGGEGLGIIRNAPMVGQMTGRGFAVIAPDGQPRENGKGRTWGFHPDRPSARDEIAFLMAVADDAASRFGLDRGQMLLAGFSIGGSMTSYVACARPQAFAAYAPVAGSFWRPHPEACAGPVQLLYSHGKADRTVPIEGREVMPGFVQGNVFEAMDIWRATNVCQSDKPDASRTLGIYTIEDWTRCAPGGSLSFALHGGGHSIPKGWAQMAMDWFDALR